MTQTDLDSEDKSVTTCIFCGKSIKKTDIVRYRDWVAHKSCAQETMDIKAEEYNPIYFKLGVIGPLIAVGLTLPILYAVLSSGWVPSFVSPSWEGVVFYFNCPVDYTWAVTSFVLNGIGFLGASIGFYGMTKNYDEGVPLAAVGLSLITSLMFFVTAIWLSLNGTDLSFYDPETGLIVYSLIYGLQLSKFTSMMLCGLTMIFLGISLFLLQDDIGFGLYEGIFAIILGGIGFAIPIVVLLGLGFIVISFLRFGFPKRISEMVDVPDLE